MNLLHTCDGKYYRRWINLLPTFLMPGSAQFLAGRKKTGVLWFGGWFLSSILSVIFLIHPAIQLSRDSLYIYFGIFGLVMAIDGMRYPIPKQGIAGWICLFCFWGCVIGFVLGIRQFALEAFRVPTGGMQPTIMGNRTSSIGTPVEGDRILVNKLIYRFSEPQRGDVVVFSTTGIPFIEQDGVYVKRIVGLPNETISIDPPNILVNGSVLKDPPIFRKISVGVEGYNGYVLMASMPKAILKTPSDSIILGPDEYLVFGDNSRSSLDSRIFGPVKRDAIIGKAFFIYYPPTRQGKIQ